MTCTTTTLHASRHHSRMALAMLLLFAAVCPSASAWWNDDWQFRKKLTFDTTSNGVALSSAVSEVTIPVQLQIGNFPYFVDVQADGADLRFVAGDDATPLPFHIERFEPAAGLAVIWVQVPRLQPKDAQQHIWMYYGNTDASSASDPAASYSASHSLVMHFAERAGLPRDSTAFGHHATTTSVQLGASGRLDQGIELEGAQGIAIDPRPSLETPADQPFAFSAWVYPKSADGGTLFRQGEGPGRVTIALDDTLAPRVTVGEVEAIDLTGSASLEQDRWHHVVVAWDDQLTIYKDGVENASAAIPRVGLSGGITIGATDDGDGFAGLLDEVQLARDALDADEVRIAALGTTSDTRFILYGEDEAEGAEQGLGEYFGLFLSLLGAVRPEGWLVILAIGILGLLAADVVIHKLLLMRRTERADQAFLAGIGNASDVLSDTARSEASVLARIQDTARRDAAELKLGAGDLLVTPQVMEYLRSNLDAVVVDEAERLNGRMLILTIAVSGGPFLGLLGTVLGVMVTFAAIAASGDVNVNTIAPGVAAALATTVMGLLVAIPALFAYNHLSARITRRVTAMEVFADRVVARLAMPQLGQNTEAARNAA